jgi:hypothetical protein
MVVFYRQKLHKSDSKTSRDPEKSSRLAQKDLLVFGNLAPWALLSESKVKFRDFVGNEVEIEIRSLALSK